MMKNISFIIISFLYISCNQNNNEGVNEDINKELSSQLAIDSNINDSENTEKGISDNSSSYGPIDMLRVFPENLKVDGSKRYFLNDTLFTGLSCHYENDLMLFEIQFKDGRKHGTSRFWYKNGQQKSLLTFKNGQPSGKYKLWDKSDKLVEEDIH